MKLGPHSQSLFPVALMLLLVGLTFWLQRTTELKEGGSDSRLRHDPDYIVENFTLRRFAPGGTVQNTLVAEKMVHYPDDETTIVEAPRVSLHGESRTTRLSAKQGLVGPDAREVELTGDVRGVREAPNGDAAIIFTTTHLRILPDSEVVRTLAAVTIRQEASIIRGVGLEADNKTQVFQLLSQVSSTIEKKQRRTRP